MKIGNITEQRWEIGKITLKGGFFVCIHRIIYLVGGGDENMYLEGKTRRNGWVKTLNRMDEHGEVENSQREPEL